MDKADQARKNRRRGKRTQRRMNMELGAENVGVFGGEDGKSDRFSFEHKSRIKFIGESFMVQAEKNCPAGKIPIVVVHTMKDRYENDIVMVRLKHIKGFLK